MALPVRKDITIYQGDTFTMRFTLRSKNLDGSAGAPIDLTGAVVQSQIRSAPISSGVLGEFTCTHDDEGGQVTMVLTAEDTTGLIFDQAVYDVQVVFLDGVVKTYLAGKVQLIHEVTRV